VSESLAIETVDLRKRFDATDALRGLNLRVPQGSIFGFLGRNGAGKTTTIKLLLGLARPTAGQARVLGMRSKLSLLLALCRGAELLVLDEPTSGLDPAASEEVLQAIVTHVSTEQLTVFFSTHQLADVDQIADHIAIIDGGRTIVSGALDDLRGRYRRVQLVFNGEAPDITFHAPGVVRVRRQGRVLTALSNAGGDSLIEEAMRFGPVSAEVLPVTLKEIFLESVAAED